MCSKALKIYPLLLLFCVISSCQDGTFMVTARVADDASAETSPTYATFNGWTQVKAVGAKNPAPQASDLATTAASVTLSWNDMTSTAGTMASYKIYRSTTSGGQNYSAPLASGITTAAKTYTDSTVTGGTTYYYTVAPLLTNGTSTRPALTDRKSVV